MYRKVIVGWDGGDQAHDALALAGLLRAQEAIVVAACVVSEDEPPPAPEWQAALTATGSDWAEPRAVSGRTAAHGLQDLAEELDADLIVVGSSRSDDVGRVVAGSVADHLLYESSRALALAPNGFRDLGGVPRVVGVAYDGSEESTRGLEVGAAIALSHGASLRLVGVVSPLELADSELVQHPRRAPKEAFERRRGDFLRMLETAARSVPKELSPDIVVVEGRPGDMIVREAWDGVHLLLMGSPMPGRDRRALVDRTARDVMRRAPCPVVVVPGRAAAPNPTSRSPLTARA